MFFCALKLGLSLQGGLSAHVRESMRVCYYHYYYCYYYYCRNCGRASGKVARRNTIIIVRLVTRLCVHVDGGTHASAYPVILLARSRIRNPLHEIRRETLVKKQARIAWQGA